MLPASPSGPSSPPERDDEPGDVPRDIADPADAVLSDGVATLPAEGYLQLDGPSGLLRVWLGGSSDPAALEADVRAVSASGQPRPAIAVALGEVARRHRLEVRVIPRVEAGVRILLVVFGRRVPGFRR
jgi:hypothetical protein